MPTAYWSQDYWHADYWHDDYWAGGAVDGEGGGGGVGIGGGAPTAPTLIIHPTFISMWLLGISQLLQSLGD